MALENQTEQASEQTENQEDTKTQTVTTDSVGAGNPSSVEDTAREQGWRPKEEYDGDPSKWVSAETFVAKGELIDRIEQLGKKLKDSEKTIKLLSDHHQKVKESEFKRAVEFLKAQKKTAYENGDVDKIIELDDKIAEVRDVQKAQTKAETTQTPDVNEDFESWVSDNKWYTKNSEMRADADAFGEAYFRNNPEKTPEEVLEYVTKRIKKSYPEEFQNPNRNRPSSVEGAGQRQGVSRDTFQLTEEEEKAMKTFVRQGIMSKEEYVSQVKSMRGN